MDHTQERLLDTAAELFSTQGYAGVSMRDIARAMGFTQAAIYHHFPNKDALYIAAITYLFEQRTQGIGEQLADVDDPAARLELLIGSMLETLDQDPRFRRIYMRELLDGDEQKLAAIADSAFTAFYEPMYELMSELAPASDPQLLIFSMAGMVFHHLEVRKLAPHLPHANADQRDLSSLAGHITGLILHGVQAS